MNFDFDFKFDVDSYFEDVQTRIIVPKENKSAKKVLYKYAKDFVRAIDINDANTYALVSGNFIFGDFIEEFIVYNNLNVIDLKIATLSLSENNIDSLAGLIEKDYVQNLDLIISEYFYGFERFKIVKYIYENTRYR